MVPCNCLVVGSRMCPPCTNLSCMPSDNVFIYYFYSGSNYYVRILSTIDKELLKPNASVALHKHSNALVDVLPPEADSSIAMLTAEEKPDVAYADIGGKITMYVFKNSSSSILAEVVIMISRQFNLLNYHSIIRL